MKKFSSIMKGSSRRASRNKKLFNFAAWAVGLIILGMLLPGLFSFVGSVVMSPVVMVREWVVHSSDSLPVYLRSRAELNKEIDQLEEELARDRVSRYSMRLLQSENDAFRELLRAQRSPRTLAGVVARPNSLPYDVIQVDRGSDDGVSLNAPVFVGVDQVVGYVSHVNADHSFVTMVSSPRFSSTVYILGPDIYTPAEGVGGGMIRVRVPQGIDLAVGDLVILPAVESGVFGEVVSVEALPTQPEQYGYVSSGVPLQELRYVTIGDVPMSEQTFSEAREHVEGVAESYFTVPVPAGVLVDPARSASTSASSSDTDTSL